MDGYTTAKIYLQSKVEELYKTSVETLNHLGSQNYGEATNTCNKLMRDIDSLSKDKAWENVN